MNQLRGLVYGKPKDRACPGCGLNMSYAAVHGKYFCRECGHSELDLYGKMKELVEENPSVSKIEMSYILGVPLRSLTPYIQDGVLDNPYKNIL